MSNRVELSDDGKVAIEMLRYHRAKIAEHKESEAQYRAIIEAEMGDGYDVATVDGQEVVIYKHVKSNRLDTAALKAADPLTYATYCKTSESRRFVVVEPVIAADAVSTGQCDGKCLIDLTPTIFYDHGQTFRDNYDHDLWR